MEPQMISRIPRGDGSIWQHPAQVRVKRYRRLRRGEHIMALRPDTARHGQTSPVKRQVSLSFMEITDSFLDEFFRRI